jgi:hypothetical protein
MRMRELGMADMSAPVHDDDFETAIPVEQGLLVCGATHADSEFKSAGPGESTLAL